MSFMVCPTFAQQRLSSPSSVCLGVFSLFRLAFSLGRETCCEDLESGLGDPSLGPGPERARWGLDGARTAHASERTGRVGTPGRMGV